MPHPEDERDEPPIWVCGCQKQFNSYRERAAHEKNGKCPANYNKADVVDAIIKLVETEGLNFECDDNERHVTCIANLIRERFGKLWR